MTTTHKITATPTATAADADAVSSCIRCNAAESVDQRRDYPTAAAATAAYWRNVVDTCSEERLTLPLGSKAIYLTAVRDIAAAARAARAARAAAAAAYDAARAARDAAATALSLAKERCYETNKALTAANAAHATALRDYLDAERAANT